MLRFILAVALTLIIANPADAFTHGSAGGSPPPPVSCPQATDNGCAAANQNSSFININLLTTAQQSGQNSLLPTRAGGSLTLNIPAVDYPVGPDSTLTPQDPRTISTANCSYLATGGPSNGPYVACYGTGVITVTLNNYDFCGTKIGKTPIQLYLGGSPSAGSSATVTNSYFCDLSGGNTTNTPFGFSGNWSVVYKYNQCDESTAGTTSGFCIRDDGDTSGTSIDIEYTAFTNLGVGRVAGGFRYMTTTWKYNFIQGLNDLHTANHGEVALRTCSQNGCTSSEYYEGNFVIWNTTALGSVNNATFFPSTGNTNGLRLSSFGLVNNIVVTNLANSTAVIGKALFTTASASLGDVTITGNRVDATGAFFCGISGVASGGNTVTASASGNTITITGTSSSFNNNPIEVGWMIFHSGFTAASITARGTGVGNLGTYTFDGSPQTIGSDSAWTLVPGYRSQTLSENYNLVFPGTAIGFTGPQMTAAVCLH